MTFEIETPASAKVLDIAVLSQKDRQPDEDPGLQVKLNMRVPNSWLTMFDGGLLSALYTKNANSNTPPQQPLDGMPAVSDRPNLTTMGQLVGNLHFPKLELTGYTLIFDYGVGGASNIELSDCKVDGFKVTAMEGGTVELEYRVETPKVPPHTLGDVATLKSTMVEIMLSPPEVQNDLASDDKCNPFPKVGKDGKPLGAKVH